ncbi:MAG: hypothetical protein J7501_03165 [Bdellovibrio sp.]|nr:hypothetical protein [Bdellovibrio sp.]
MKFLIALVLFFSSQVSFARITSAQLRAEFQRAISEDVLPRVIEYGQARLDQQAAVQFTGAIVNFSYSFTKFTDSLCIGHGEGCMIARYTEGIELAHNLMLIPDVDSSQLVLPTRPFQRIDELCQGQSLEDTSECMKNILDQKESRLLQTANPDVAEAGVRMAKDYSTFAMYLNHEDNVTSEHSYFWNYDYALHYLEDRLSDYY